MEHAAPPSTLLSIFHNRVATDRDRNCLHWKAAEEFQSCTWGELAQQVGRAAVGLGQLGVQPADRVIQVAENRYEWIVCDLAIQFAQAVHVPVHAPLTGEQIAFQIKDSGAKVALVSNEQQLAKLRTCQDQLPGDLQLVTFNRCDRGLGSDPPRLLSDLLECATDQQVTERLQQAVSAVTPRSLATILYTSGTTGEPKGVMLSQHNLASNALAALGVFLQTPDDIRLSFLPHSHIFARTCDVYTWMASGCQLAIAESRDTVLADCAAVKPTLLNGVPYFFDRVRRYLIEQGRDKEPGSLREALGGRMRLCCSGGAALPDHVFDFYQQQGLPILQGYGLTETSPVICASSEADNRRGCVGRAVAGVEVRIAEDGEILTRGPHVMQGYYNNQVATDEVIRDGWFHTGDLGELDDDGYLTITGRKKELIVTSGGKNVAPVMLESLLCEDPLILQALVIGNDRDYLTALIVPDAEKLRDEMKAREIRCADNENPLTHPDVLGLFQDCITQRLAGVSHYEQVQKFTLLERGFTIESGELTPKLSLRRGHIEANFAAQIEAMYKR